MDILRCTVVLIPIPVSKNFRCAPRMIISVEVALLLFEAGAEIEPRSNDGWTPLHSAARWNNDAMASLLLSRGANVNSKTNGNLTPLQLATSEKEMLAVISVLVAEPHCDVTTKNGKRQSMLQFFTQPLRAKWAISCPLNLADNGFASLNHF